MKEFPISRDPPEGGTIINLYLRQISHSLPFPISRDPPEGGTSKRRHIWTPDELACFQFLGIPPKGEPRAWSSRSKIQMSSFQFLGIPPKGEPTNTTFSVEQNKSIQFPISRDPPEGGTEKRQAHRGWCRCSGFQFLGIPPKGEPVKNAVKLSADQLQFPISRDPPEGGTEQEGQS